MDSSNDYKIWTRFISLESLQKKKKFNQKWNLIFILANTKTILAKCLKKWKVPGYVWKFNFQYLGRNAASNFEQVLEATPYKTAALLPPTTHHENYQS